MVNPSAPPARTLVALLQQLADVIQGLDDSEYVLERATKVSGSIGGQVRHCLDHVGAFLEGLPGGSINYDLRQRGTDVERRRESALMRIESLSGRLLGIEGAELDRPVVLEMALEFEGRPAIVTSTAGRELGFVVSHTIHHFAIIALLLRESGIDVPHRFGYAPSTPAANAA